MDIGQDGLIVLLVVFLCTYFEIRRKKSVVISDELGSLVVSIILTVFAMAVCGIIYLILGHTVSIFGHELH